MAPYMSLKPLPDFAPHRIGELLSFARQTRPETIFCYGGPETVLALILKHFTGVKVVRFRGQSTKSFSPLSSLRQRWSHKRIDLLLTPSQLVSDEVQRLGITNKTCKVALGCDDQVFHRPLDVRQSNQERPEMLVFGRFDPVKGHSAMIRRMPALLRAWGEQANKPMLHIMGDPANVSVLELEGHVKRAGLKLGHDVRISTGRQENVAALLSRAVLGVVPSLGSEIICRVAEEFLLCGTPVAVSGAGSLPEVLMGPDGFCFADLSEEEISAQIIYWLKQSLIEGEEQKLKRAERAREFYSLAAMAKNLETALSVLN